MLSNGEVAIRLLLAAGVGGLIGVEREIRDQPAGFRTHILVSVGSCLFTLVGAYGFTQLAAGEGAGPVRADVTRVASQIVVGIGFLGGGAILREGQTVRGLTTAASLWVTAAMGMAVAIGYYVGAGVAAAIAFVSLAALKPLEKRFRRIRQQQPPPPDEH